MKRNNVLFLNTLIYIFSVTFIVFIDIICALHFDEMFRFIINYVIVPIVVFILFLKNKKCYIALLIYEILIGGISLIAYYGIDFILYFWFPNIWQIFNNLSIDLSIVGISVWFQPVILCALAVFLAKIIKSKNNAGDGSLCR